MTTYNNNKDDIGLNLCDVVEQIFCPRRGVAPLTGRVGRLSRGGSAAALK